MTFYSHIPENPHRVLEPLAILLVWIRLLLLLLLLTMTQIPGKEKQWSHLMGIKHAQLSVLSLLCRRPLHSPANGC